MTTPDPGLLPRPANPDIVTRYVSGRAIAPLLASLLVAWGIDTQVSGPLADALVAVIPALGTLAGALWGARGARERVTPTSRYGTPRDHDGVALVRAAHDQSTGYPPRVDRHGIDHDPGDSV